MQTGQRGMGPPITYEFEGKQYISFMGGTGQGGRGGTDQASQPRVYTLMLDVNSGPSAAAVPTSEVERTAQKHIDGICSTCHEASLIRETQATKEEWLDIVRRMNGKGAGLSESDVELLADFLAKNYGRK
jgi:hypothetical protein